MIRLFGSRRVGEQAEVHPRSKINVSWGRHGVAFIPDPADEAWLDEPSVFGADSELVLLLRQLEEEGYIEVRPSGASMDWESYYRLEAVEGFLSWVSETGADGLGQGGSRNPRQG